MNISNKSEQKSSCKRSLLCGLLYRIDDKDGGCDDHADNDGGNSEDEIDADERWKKRVVIGIDAASAGVDGNDNVVVTMTDNNKGDEIKNTGDGGGEMLR